MEIFKDIISQIRRSLWNNVSYDEFVKRLILIITFSIVCLTVAFAQEEGDLGTEVVNIVKPYTPTISDAFKVKETPVLNDSVTTAKKEVRYEIFSVPVASTFTPAKGKAANVEKAKPSKLYDNYATLGFGNYTSALAELYSNFQISRTDNAGFFLRHNSAQGDVDGIRVETKYYDTSLEGNYSSRQKDMSYEINGGFEHQLFNWYGISPFFDSVSDQDIDGIDIEQTYFSAKVGGNLKLEESVFEGIDANLRFLADSYSSAEFNFRARPRVSFPLTTFTLQIDGDVDFIGGGFDRNYFTSEESNYNFLNVGVSPKLVYVDEDLTLSLGVAGYLGMDNENSDSKFYLYPRINASYRLVNEILIVYGGAEGGLNQNSYYDFKNENPFVSPTLMIAPTSQLYDAFGGLKGKLSNAVGYNVRASYGKEENKALFRANSILNTQPEEAYQYGNSFGLVYDDVNTLSLFGELKVEVAESFTLGINAEYFSYSMTDQDQPWNLPEITATVFSNFNITDKIYGGASLFFVGERTDLFTGTTTIFGDMMVEERVLDSYFDANVHLGYRVNDRLNIFAKGSNLVGENYEKWLNFPVLGIQGLLGATYKFDW